MTKIILFLNEVEQESLYKLRCLTEILHNLAALLVSTPSSV